jgi:hypothetical protein
MRTAQSVRFDTYYKIQFHDPISLAWKDIQKAYPSEEDARAAFTSDKTWRVMCVTSTGRFPL